MRTLLAFFDDESAAWGWSIVETSDAGIIVQLAGDEAALVGMVDRETSLNITARHDQVLEQLAGDEVAGVDLAPNFDETALMRAEVVASRAARWAYVRGAPGIYQWRERELEDDEHVDEDA